MSFQLQEYLRIIRDEAQNLRETSGIPRGRSSGNRNGNSNKYSSRNENSRYERDDMRSRRDDDSENKWTSKPSGGKTDYYGHCDRQETLNPYARRSSDRDNDDRDGGSRYGRKEEKSWGRNNEDSDDRSSNRYRNNDNDRGYSQNRTNPYALPPSDKRDDDRSENNRYSGRDNDRYSGRDNDRDSGRNDRYSGRDNDRYSGRDNDRDSGRDNKYSSRNFDSDDKWTRRSNDRNQDKDDNSYGDGGRQNKPNPYSLPSSDNKDDEYQNTRNGDKYSGRFDDRSVAKSKDHSSDNRYSERSSPRRYKNDDDRNDRRSIDNNRSNGYQKEVYYSSGQDSNDRYKNDSKLKTYDSSQTLADNSIDSYQDFDRLLVEYKSSKYLRFQHIIMELESKQIYEKMEFILNSSSCKKVVMIIQRANEFSDLTVKILKGKGFSVENLNEKNVDNREHNKLQTISTTFGLLASHPDVKLEFPDIVINCDLVFKRVKYLERYLRYLFDKRNCEKITNVEIYHIGLTNTPFVRVLREMYE